MEHHEAPENAINNVPGGCIGVYLTTELYINEKNYLIVVVK